MLITIEELERFSGVIPQTDATQTSLLETYIGSAQDIINNYLGFDAESCIDWGEQSVEHIVYSADGVTFYSNVQKTISVTIPEGVTVVLVSGEKYHYFTTQTQTAVPAIVKLVCLEIATLIQTEENSNIGVNTNSDVGVSRTFLNIVDYTKYLQKLSAYRQTTQVM